MAQMRGSPPVHARLLGIQLPRMKIDAGGLLLLLIDESDSPSRVPVGKQSQVCAAPQWGPVPREGKSRHREFNQIPLGAADRQWKARGLRHAVIRMADGKDSGVIGESDLGENLEGPKRTGSDGKAGGAVAAHGPATSIL